MRKRIYTSTVILLAMTAICTATITAFQKKHLQQTKATSRSARGQVPPRGRGAANRRASAQTGPVRLPDPNRAPQNLVDDALYTNEEFFGAQASVARPYAVAF